MNNLKRIVSLLIVLSMLILPIPMEVYAASNGTCGENLTWTLDATGTLTITGSGNMDNYSYNGAPWYSERSSINEVIIGNGVTKIGSYAFYYCWNLAAITIPASVTSISNDAFYCASLKHMLYQGSQSQWESVSIGYDNSSLTNAAKHYNVSTDMVYAEETCSTFTWNCTQCGVLSVATKSTKSHRFQNGICTRCGVQDVWSYSFNNNTVTIEGYSGRDDHVVIPEAIEGFPVTRIGYEAFEGKSMSAITIPATITYIEEYAFRWCDNLSGVYITNLSAWCKIEFDNDWGCSNPLHYAGNLYLNGVLVTDLVIPSDVEEISEDAFQYCGSLISVTIPDTVKKIGAGSFMGCAQLEKVTVGDGVTEIDDSAFEDCSLLAEVSLGKNVQIVGNGAFYGCERLTDIELPDSVNTIRAFAFKNNTSLTKINIPSSVTKIAYYAFEGCANLGMVELPATIESIGESAFDGCNALNHVFYGGSKTTWDSLSMGSYNQKLLDAIIHYNSSFDEVYTQQTCSTIRYVCADCGIIATENKAVANHNFVNGTCTVCGVESYWDYRVNADRTVSVTGYHGGETSVAIPEKLENMTVTGIAYRAFAGMTITEVTLPDTLKSIGDEAFSNCRQLSKIDLGEGVETIGRYAFRECDALWEITIPTSVTAMENYAFYGCDKLADVYITDPNAWCKISFGSYSPMEYGDRLHILDEKGNEVTKLTLDPSVTQIPDSAFRGASLTEITLPDTVKSIGSYAFYNCESLTEITLPDIVKSIGSYAFYNCESLTTIVIPDSVTTINFESFYSCANLTTVVLGKGVKTIYDYAFKGSPIAHVFYTGTMAQWNVITKYGPGDNFLDAVRHYEATADMFTVQDSCSMLVHKCSQCGIYGGVKKTEANHNFHNGVCTLCAVEDVWSYTPVSGGVSITDYTGKETDLKIPAMLEGLPVVSIGEKAFYDCDSLTTIVIPDRVTTISSRSFAYCANLTTVVLGKDVKNIYSYAFDDSPIAHVFYTGTMAQWNAISKYDVGSGFLDAVRHYEATADMFTVQDSCSMLVHKCSQCGIYGGVKKTEANHNFHNGVCTLCAVEDVWSYTPVSGGVSITDYTGKETDLKIPAMLEGLPVVSIGGGAFCDCDSLTAVVIPAGVKSVGNGAFSECTYLTVVTIPASVTYMGYYVFGATRLSHVLYTGTKAQFDAIDTYTDTFPSGVTYHYQSNENTITTQESCSFVWHTCKECGLLGYGTKPENSHTFKNNVCTVCGVSEHIKYSLNSAELTVTGCNGDPTALDIPAKIEGLPVTKIASNAFKDNTSLLRVSVPGSVKTIASYAFYNCSKMTTLTLQEGLTTIDIRAFMYCKALESVDIPDSVTFVGNSAFRNCTSLVDVVLPEGVTYVYPYTFSGCTALSAVTIPSTVTTIDEWAFYNCKNLDHLMFGGTKSQYDAMLIDGTNDNLLTATWHYGVNETSLKMTNKQLCSAKALYECEICDTVCYQAKETADHTYENGVCASCGMARNCPVTYAINGSGAEITGINLVTRGTELKIPDTVEGVPVTSIGNRALQSAAGLTSVTIPETVTKIGYSAFRDCEALTDVYFRGDAEQWEQLFVDVNNDPLLDALLHLLGELLAGDIDCDESVTTDDVIQLLLHVSMPGAFPISTEADFTGDGKITTDDVIQLLLHVSMPDTFPLYIGK